MDIRNIIMPLAALIAAVLVGYGTYLAGSALMAAVSHGGQNGTNTTVAANASALLIAALEKPYGYATYTYDYVDLIDGYPVETRAVTTPQSSAVSVISPIFKRSIYSGSGTRVLCIYYSQNVSCSDVPDNSTLMPTFQAMQGTLFANRAGDPVRNMEIYIASGAAQFDPEIGAGSVNSVPCSIVRYVLDYSKLTLNDLETLGISPNDPALLYSKNYTFEYCIDNASNVISINLEYTFLKDKRVTNTMFKVNGWGVADSAEFSHPAAVNESVTESLFMDAIGAEKTVLACSQNKTTKDECIRRYAVNNALPDVCLLAGSQKDRCILTTAPGMLRMDLCPKMDNSSSRDDCWIEMAGRTRNLSLCSNVLDTVKNAYCVSIINASAANGSAGNLSGECASDADCFTAGCSSQLCVAAGQKDTITTCIYKPEYACLNLTSCGCNAGKCGWAQSAEYEQCYQNATAPSGNSTGMQFVCAGSSCMWIAQNDTNTTIVPITQ